MADGSLTFDTAINESGFNKGLEKLGKKAGKAAGNIADEAVELADEAAEAAEEAAGRTAEAAEEAAQSAGDSAKRARKSVEKAGEEAAETAGQASREIGDSARQAGDAAEEAAGRAEGGIEALASALAAAGIAATAKEIAEALYGCSEAASAFETGVSKVMTIADSSKASMESMERSIMELSADLGVGANELSESTYQAISASVDTAEAVDVVRDASKLAVGGFTDTATAIDILTTAMNAYGMGTDQVTRISDVLVTTQNLGKTSVGEVAGAMGKVIPLAAAYGMEIENLSTAYAVLTANGIKTDEATTYIKSGLNELGDSGSAVGKILKEKTGKGFSELTKEGKSLGDILQIVGDSVGGNAAEFNNLWSSAEAGVGMLSIYNSGAGKFNSVLGQMQGSAGATETAFRKMADTTEHAKKRFVNAAENMEIAIGGKLNPALGQLYETGAEAFEWAAEFVDSHPEIVAAVSALTVALGILVTAFAGFSILPTVTKAVQAFTAALAANPFGMVALALTTLTAALLTFQGVMEAQAEAADGNAKAVRESREAYEELRETMDDNAEQSRQNKEAIKGEYGACKVLSDRLYKLADKEKKSASDKQQMAAMVDELNSKIPSLNLSLDETTGELNKQKDATDALVESMKNQAMAAAAQDDMAQAAKAKYDAEKKLADAQETFSTLKKQAIQEEKEHKDAVKQTTDAISSSAAMSGSQERAATKTEVALAQQRKTLEELHQACDDATAEFDKAAESYAGYQGASEGVADVTGEQAAAADEAAEAYARMQESVEESIRGAVSMFSEFSGGTEISKEEVLRNLESQSAGVEEWGKDMKALAARAGEGMTKELYDYLAAMGPQSANLVKAFTQMSKDELAKAAQEFASLDDGLAESVSQQVAEASAAWGESAAELSQAAGEAGAKSTEEFTKAAESELKDGSGKVVDTASKSGTDTGKAMQKSTADAVRQGAGEVSSAVDSSMQGAENTALGYYDNFYTVGQNLMKGAAAGIAAGAPAVEKAARDAMQRTVDGSKKQIDSHSPSRVMRDEVGKMISAGAAEGIRNGIGDVEQGARDMAGASLDAAKDELDIHSPSGVFRKEVGAQIVKGIIQGIENEERKLTRKMEALSESALKIAKKANGDYSQAGSRMAELIGGSLQKRQDLATRKAEALVDKYIEKVSNTGTVARYERLAEKKEEEARKYSRKDGKGNQEKAKQLERQAKQLKKKAEKYKKQFAKFGSSLMDSLNGGIEAEFGKIREGLSERLTEISDECQRLYDDVKGRQAGMFSEMSSPVNFYDLDTQLEEVQRYQDGLNRLKGRIPDTLMEEITGMGLKDAVSFSEYLNSLTDAELEAYKGKWERLQGQAKSYSGSFFEKELVAIRAEYEKKVGEAMADAETRMKEVGKNICKGLVKGLNSEKELLSKECRKMAKGMVKEFKAAFGIHSPSKVMERQVGKYLPQGLAEGVEGALPDAERRITAGVERAIASLQGRVEALQSIPAVPYGSVSVYPQVTVMNSQPVQVQAEIHTTVDLDGRAVGHAVTPYVNERLGNLQAREERGS